MDRSILTVGILSRTDFSFNEVLHLLCAFYSRVIPLHALDIA